MIELSAGHIATIVQGKLMAPSETVVSMPPVLDSRKSVQGSLFLALRGTNADGHDFARDAISRGASLVMGSRDLEVPCIVVPDVAKALGLLAHHVRETLKTLVVIAITGSQGKTTTKDLLAGVLTLSGNTIATEQSLNNELGLPLTLLRCDERTQFCIVEMGARHEGDISSLCAIAEPNIGVVLNVGKAHVGEFGSREVIAGTKSELVRSLTSDGVAILGRYDSYTLEMVKLAKSRVITFGQNGDAQVRATDIDMREGRAHFDLVTPVGREAVALRLVGEHQISNALAAAAVCTALNIPIDVIASGLSTADMPSRMRMEIHELPDLLLIDDSYNANPESTIAALKTLALFAQERGGQSWAFLGKMHELGENSQIEHAQVGEVAGGLGIDHLVCVGTSEYSLKSTQFPEIQVHVCGSKSEAEELSQYFSPGDVVLIKGSRAEKMEELTKRLSERWLLQRVSGEE